MRPGPLSLSSFACIGILLFACILVYANSLSNQFVYDDLVVIANSRMIRSWENAPALFSRNYFSMSGERTYRPVVTLSYLVDHSFWGLNPFGYRLTNILFHALNTCFIFWLGLAVMRRRSVSFLASLLFAVHPVLSEAVNGISFREDLLCLTFFSFAFMSYHTATASDSRHPFATILAPISFCIALFAKEMALTLPLVIVLLEVCRPAGRLSWDTKKRFMLLSFAFVAAFFVLIRFVLLKDLHDELFWSPPLGRRLLTMPGIIVLYLKLLIAPITLSAEYMSSFVRSPSEMGFIVPMIICILFAGAGFLSRRRLPAVCFGIFWFLITLIPVSNVVALFNPVAERYLYLPAAGFFMAIVSGGSALYDRLKLRRLTPTRSFFPLRQSENLAEASPPKATGEGGLKIPARYALIGVFLSVFALYSFRTIERNRDWKDTATLYLKTLKTCPQSVRFLNGLATVYRDTDKRAESIVLLERAIALDDQYADSYNNLGLVLRDLGKFDAAIALFKKTIAVRADYSLSYNNLGLVYSDLGRDVDAIDMFKTAIEKNPEDATVYYNLGIAYRNIGNLDEAIRSYRKSIELDPERSQTYYNLGIAYDALGDPEQAAASYKKAVGLDPHNADAYNNLGNLSYRKNAFAEALGLFRRALLITPRDEAVSYNIGTTYYKLGKNQEAIAAYLQAIEKNPRYAKAHANLAVILLKEKRYDEAILHCDTAVALGYRVPQELLDTLQPFRRNER